MASETAIEVVDQVVNNSKIATLKDILQYKIQGLSDQQIADKYGIGMATVQRYCKTIDKRSLKKQITDLEQEMNEKKLIDSLKAEGIDSRLIAKKLKTLLNDDIKAGIQEYCKITGSYSLEKSQIEANTAMVDKYKIKLPKNERDV